MFTEKIYFANCFDVSSRKLLQFSRQLDADTRLVYLGIVRSLRNSVEKYLLASAPVHKLIPDFEVKIVVILRSDRDSRLLTLVAI